MIELSLLKALSIKVNYSKYRALLNDKTLSRHSLTLLKDYEVYFETFKLQEVIDFDTFCTFFFTTRHPFLDEKSIIEYKEILNSLAKLDLTEEIATILESFNKQELYQELTDLLERNEDPQVVCSKIEQFTKDSKSLMKGTEEDNMDLDKALEYVDRSNGLQWRLECLREHFGGGLIKGDFGIIAGYTDSGKSSFLSSELSYIAQQLVDDQYILWLNNEGDWKRILPRIYCAALNCDNSTLVRRKEEAKIRYKELMKGNTNRIVVMDIQGKHTKDIERIVESRPPALIVFDMLDHLRGFEKYMSNDGGSFERYSKLYHWALALSASTCPILATSQLNRNGSDDMYPAITELRGSGVDKQSAATFLLVIGMLTGEDSVRYLSTPKFKLGANKSWKCQVKFDPLKSRFI